MFLETVRSPGLAHLSYILGDAGGAAVIDPRRDYDAYLAVAAREGCRITHVFETHRNEDYVVGSTGRAAPPQEWRPGRTRYTPPARDGITSPPRPCPSTPFPQRWMPNILCTIPFLRAKRITAW